MIIQKKKTTDIIKSKKAIAILCSKLHPEQCGVGDYSFKLAEELCNQGFKVYLIGLKSSNPKEIIHKNLNSNFTIKQLGIKWNYQSYTRLIKYLVKKKIQIVSIQYVPRLFEKRGLPILLPLALISLKLKKIKVISFFHETYVKFSLKSARSLLLHFPTKLIALAIAFISDEVMTSIEFYAKQLKLPKSKILRIPSNFQIKPLEIDLSLANNNNDTEFLTMALFRPKKWSSSFIIDNLADLHESLPYLKIKIIGDPNGLLFKSDNFDSKLDYIEFTGRLTTSEIIDSLRSCDIFLSLDYNNSPDQWNGISTKSGTVASGYYAGLPVLGIKAELTDSVFVHMENIYFISPELDDLIAAVKLLKEDIFKRKLLSSQSLLFYEKKLAWRHTLKVYREVLMK